MSPESLAESKKTVDGCMGKVTAFSTAIPQRLCRLKTAVRSAIVGPGA